MELATTQPIDDDELPESGDDLPPPPSRPMAAIPGYADLVEIGRGGMGVVYRALHLRLGRPVALKLLRSGAWAAPAERERFLREARAGAALQHPNIVQVYDVGEFVGCSFLAMELVEGGTLAHRLAAGPLPARTTAEFIETIARAVHYAHEHGVIHRDLKPANVLLPGIQEFATALTSGIGTRTAAPKIADFGLARLLADEPGATATGTILGTPSYMAPEQAVGGGAVSMPADVYALGAIMYECLTGRPPFRAASALETLHQVESAEPVAPSRLQPSTPRDLNTVCLTCLQKEPRKRYASAAALADDLRRYLDGQPVLARPVGPWERVWRWCRRNPRVAGLLAALLIALTAGFLGVFGQWQRAERLYVVADGQRVAAQENLQRYQQAADDFASLVDLLDTDQLFHLRAAPLRPELLTPALARNRDFLMRHGTDPNRRADVVRAHFRVAILLRLLSNDFDPTTRTPALAAARIALTELEAFAGERPTAVQYRRDRAALTHNLGFLLHATQEPGEALPMLESACRQRQALLDEQPENLDYRSELAGCWNDVGLAQRVQQRFEESLAALERAVQLQQQTADAAPQVPRYRRLLSNHHFNRAMTLCALNRSADAAAAAAECCRWLPDDPQQSFRAARILAICAKQSGEEAYASESLRLLQQAVDLGFDDLDWLNRIGEFEPVRARPEFRAVVTELERMLAAKPAKSL